MAFFPMIPTPRDYLPADVLDEHGKWRAAVIETDRLLQAAESAPKEARAAFCDDVLNYDLAGALDRLRDAERTKALLSQEMLRLHQQKQGIAHRIAAAYQGEGERATAALEARRKELDEQAAELAKDHGLSPQQQASLAAAQDDVSLELGERIADAAKQRRGVLNCAGGVTTEQGKLLLVKGVLVALGASREVTPPRVRTIPL